MSNNLAFSKKQLAVAIAVGLLVNVVYQVLVPTETKLASRDATVDWLVPFILLTGGYALLRGRADDLDYYKSVSAHTKEIKSRLEKRYRLLGVAGWVLVGAGAIRTANLLYLNFH